MKKFFKTTLTILCLLTLLFAFTACSEPVVQTDTEIVVTIKASVLKKADGDKLQDYLDALDDFTYEEKSGMIITINGVTADAAKGEYWLIYTNDAEHGNEDWGTYEYNEETYLSATLGIAELPVEEGFVYVFAISKF